MDIHEYRTKAPELEPLTLDQVKADRVVEHDEHNDMFESFIKAAREMAESRTGRALVDQEWQQTIPFNTEFYVPLIKSPVKELVSVKVDDEDVDLDGLEFLPGDDSVVSGSCLVGKRVQIVYRAGYGGPEDVPAALRKWMLSQIGSMYEYRESEVVGSITSRLKFTDSLLSQFVVRRYW